MTLIESNSQLTTTDQSITADDAKFADLLKQIDEEVSRRRDFFGVDVLDEMAKYTYVSKYARYRSDLGRRENWEESVDRVRDMHLRKFSGLDSDDIDAIIGAFDLVKDRKVLPSMRTMQFGGLAVEKNNARNFNCSVLHIHSVRSFAESFFLLLSGCGVGFGLSDKFLGHLPDLVSAEDKTGTVLTYVIEDTLEGWADSVEALLSCYFKGTAFSGRKIVFDYSKIRPAGAELKTSGGKAPGHEGLKAGLSKIKALMDHIIEDEGHVRMKTIHAYDILMHIADCVLSGGIRRAATAVIFQPDDMDMMTAKSGDWFIENPQRGRSNNSVIIDRNNCTLEQFKEVVNIAKEYGEPGFVFSNMPETALYNPCFTGSQRVLTDEGWRSFKELTEASESGKEIFIHQDPRWVGNLDNSGNEYWTSTGSSQGGSTVLNRATKVGLTQRNAEVFRLNLKNGMSVEATGNHEFMTQAGMIRLDNLSSDDRVLIGVPEGHVSDFESYNFKLGMLAGLIYGDGVHDNGTTHVNVWKTPGRVDDIEFWQNIINDVLNEAPEEVVSELRGQAIKTPVFRKANSGDSSVEKFTMQGAILNKLMKIELGFMSKKDSVAWLHDHEKDLKAGFVSGLFYADGNVQSNVPSQDLSFQIVQSNKQMLQEIQLVLQELGIKSSIHILKEAGVTRLPLNDGSGEYGDFWAKASYRLLFGGKQQVVRAKEFLQFISLDGEKLDQAISEVFDNNLKSDPRNGTRYWAYVENIEPLGIQDVYCLEENVARTAIVEGMSTRRCFEIAFSPIDQEGQLGVQFCNLTSINWGKISSAEEFLEAAEAAAIIGTLQASYTDFPYLNKASKNATEEESLLGVSMTAMMEKPELAFDPDLQTQGAGVVVDTNKTWADKIGIAQAARTTCVKPEGTSTIVVSSLFSGIHPAHSEYMFRRIQANKLDNVYQHFNILNSHATEPSQWSANGTDDVITFPIKNDSGALFKADLDSESHLDLIKSTQQHWVRPGTTSANVKDLEHNVSCTVIVEDGNWDNVAEYLFNNRNDFSAVSLLGVSGDKDYVQAPNESVATIEDAEKFLELLKNFSAVDYSLMFEQSDNTSHSEQLACAGPQGCEIL